MLTLTMSERKRKPGRPKSAPPDLIVIQARVSPDLHAALEAAAASGRRTKNAELVLALEEHLKALGLWPRGKKG